jgi:ubiquitin C-terminal hydrolase
LKSGTVSRYQLAAVISHMGEVDEYLCHYIAFVRVFGQWIRFHDIVVTPVNESAALEDNFPEEDGSAQTASILIDVSYY